MTKMISINGQPGSFHEEACTQHFGSSVRPVHCTNFKEVFQNVVTGKTSLGLVAIENSLYGSINEVDALLLETGCQIVDEVYLRINFCLIGQNQTELSNVKDIYSQDIAIVQCQKWLDKNLPNARQHDIGDTAGAVSFVAESKDLTKVAVASKNAAELYGMSVLVEEIENDKKNFTRFVIIQKNPKEISNSDKTSIVLQTANKPGSLYEVLGLFKNHQINLTKLDSKPIAGKPWEYMFYIDFEAGTNSKKCKLLISELDTTGHDVHVLGSYKSATPPKS